MIGSPGSAHLGPAAENHIDLAAFAPGGQRVAVVRGGSLLFGDLGDGGWGWHRLAEDGGGIARIAWNRAGSVVAAYDAASRRVTLWRNIAEAPEAVTLAELPAGSLTALAAEDDSAVAAFEDGDTGGVYRIAAENARLVTAVARPTSLAIVGGTLYIADAGRGEILRVLNYREAPVVERFAVADEPSAIALLNGGRTLAVTVKDAILSWNLDAPAEVRRIELAFRPTRLEPVGEGSVFLLTARMRVDDVLQSFDSAAPEPVVRFVPAGEAPPSESVR